MTEREEMGQAVYAKIVQLTSTRGFDWTGIFLEDDIPCKSR